MVSKGRELLKSKREALMKEFMGLVDECVKTREELSRLMSRARRNLELSRARDGEALQSLAVKGSREITLDIMVKRVWGVKIPEVVERPLVRSVEARDVSITGESALSLDTARGFERVVSLLVRMASAPRPALRASER